MHRLFQTRWATVTLLLLMAGTLSYLLAGGCGKGQQGASTQPASVEPRIISLVPSATDLILGMGAGEHLVGVSTFDTAARVKGLPRVGDYQTVDWEQIHRLKPQVMVIFQGLDRVPAGMSQQAKDLNIQLVNVRTETLNDIYRELDHLGQLLHETKRAEMASAELHRRLEAVSQRVAGRKQVRTLIVLDANGSAVAGPGTFLDDLLNIAGGVNVMAANSAHWPQLDQEQIQSLNPEAIIQLLPDASPQVLLAAQQAWTKMPDLAAVKYKHVHVMTDPTVLISGYHVADLAEQMADALHGPDGTGGDAADAGRQIDVDNVGLSNATAGDAEHLASSGSTTPSTTPSTAPVTTQATTQSMSRETTQSMTGATTQSTPQPTTQPRGTEP